MSNKTQQETITWNDFEKIDIRKGTIVDAMAFPKAKKPAYKLTIDFGQFGIKRSSAQVTDYYTPEKLVGQEVVAVINFPPKQVADFISECLVLGVYDEHHKVVLLAPQQTVPNGSKIG